MKLSLIGIVSSIIAFISSWSWLIVNINQPNHSSGETIDEEQRINDIQNALTISWLFATIVTIVITIIVIKYRNANAPQGGNSTNYGRLVFISLSFIVTNPHFAYIFLIVTLDLIFTGI